jgi:hypothetical protein
MPKRIQMSRQKPWRADNPDAVIVARPTSLGNPYYVARCIDPSYGWRVVSTLKYHDAVGPTYPTKLAATEAAVQRFRAWAARQNPALFASARGRDVACWCPIGSPCHGDVILEFANATSIHSLPKEGDA